MKRLVFFTITICACGQTPAHIAGSLSEIHRVYVDQLAGGASARAMREILIASLDATGLFILTDDESRADAILRGAADDKTFTDSFDSDKSVTGRSDAGARSGGLTSRSSGGGYGAFSGGERESYHIRDRKHEAYAAVRLVNRAGDTLWSTTKESLGAKFHSASTDVGEKVARQITADMERVSRSNALAARP